VTVATSASSRVPAACALSVCVGQVSVRSLARSLGGRTGSGPFRPAGFLHHLSARMGPVQNQRKDPYLLLTYNVVVRMALSWLFLPCNRQRMAPARPQPSRAGSP